MKGMTPTEQLDNFAITQQVASEARQTRDEFRVLDKRIAHLESVLRLAQEKLAIYRAGTAGEYTGGLEYTALIALIDSALGTRS